MRSRPLLRRSAVAAAAILLAACGHDSPASPGDPLAGGSGTGADRLLSDAELATPADPAAAGSDAGWIAWVRAHRQPVRSLTSSRFDDLRFLQPLLAGKRIVQLGESAHGVSEYDQAKVRLVKYLHEELGYDVVAFESGLYDCWSADGRFGAVSDRSVMRRCLPTIWQTAEVLALIDYIQQTKSTAHPLHLAGVDVQLTSDTENFSAPIFLDGVIGRVDPAYATRIRALDSTFVTEHDEIAVGASRYWRSYAAMDSALHASAAYDSLTAWFDAHSAQLEATYGADPAPARVARQLAFSRAHYLRELDAVTIPAQTAVRDPGMADNLDALLDRIYPGAKVIVWAHNFHVQADRPHAFADTDPDNSAIATMGTYVAQRHRAELYDVGMFMYRGTAATNDGFDYAVTEPAAGSLEATFFPVRMKQFFVDLSTAGSAPGTEWIHRHTVSKDWGITPVRQVIGDQYDGILFIDTSHPPSYL